jgi:hypothetical protein
MLEPPIRIMEDTKRSRRLDALRFLPFADI